MINYATETQIMFLVCIWLFWYLNCHDIFNNYVFHIRYNNRLYGRTTACSGVLKIVDHVRSGKIDEFEPKKL